MRRLAENKGAGIFMIAVCLFLLGYAIYRDFGYGKGYGGDLRNRVTGARLIRDGKSPYFYQWQTKDGFRYYDTENFNSRKISVMTASPFFHHLFGPLAEMPQWKIDWWWCGIQYLLLFGMTTMAYLLVGTNMQRWATMLVAALFLFTDAWKMSIFLGQYYLLIPFLTMVIYFILRKSRKPLYLSVAGLASIVLVLIRPNALIIFIPFLLLLRNYSRYELLAFFIPVLLLTGWTLGNEKERLLWQDYIRSIGEQVILHQYLPVPFQQNAPDPKYAEWEGIKRSDQIAYRENYYSYIHSENNNVFLLLYAFGKFRVKAKFIDISACFIIVVLTGIYYRKHRQDHDYDLTRTALLGYGLYMITDLFAPIQRAQYYTVQCLFLLLVAASIYQAASKRIFLLLLTGLVFNTRIPFTTREHAIGEYLIIVVILVFSLSKKESYKTADI
jgi:hypothetical protein